MNRLKKKWIYAASGALLLAFLLFGVRQIWAQQTNPLLSEQEIKQIISKAYVGKVESLQLNENSNPPQYVAKLKNGDRWYELHVGGYNGDILHLKQISEAGVPKDPTNPNVPGKENPGTGQPTNPNVPGNGSTPITKEEAKQIAKTQFKGKLSSLELKIQPDGSRYYEAKLENNKESITMYINEADGEVLKKEITSKPDKKPTNNNSMPITESEAKSIALNAVKGTFKSIDLEEENGVPVYEVDIKTTKGTKKVYINAYSGAVIASVTDDDDDDDSDDDDNESKKEVKGVSTDNKSNNNLNSNNTNKNNNGGSIINKPSKPTSSKPDKTNQTNNNNTSNNGGSTETTPPVNNDDDQVGSQPNDDDDDDDDMSNNDSNNTSNNSSNNSSTSTDDDDDDDY
ncbi:PepSY domain-containing protein [Paenibacillus sp. SC116]|uniref:PepSY domain-containing protein n=1 Tax=Paenibacillus sp. SC116 TaxID=2968986 RepID=UPI00215B0518|nr:PepSY domain-containing protein [Paenibacillus sp. SC116]MCR8845711.1 PepSY domain-containing protein [Paenibacillus sp. SC116]